MDIRKWTLTKGEPTKVQIEIIDEILEAIDDGYENIILDAGTGIGKSPIATTIAQYFDETYLVAGVTNQLLSQYKRDFNKILAEIKGRKNYKCNFEGTCDECSIHESNKRRLQEYYEQLKKYNQNPDKYNEPVKPELDKECKDCPYKTAFNKALASPTIITNYDYLYTAGNYAGILPERDLIIFDEAHNIENKLLSNVTYSLNRKTIFKNYKIDIFDGIIDAGFTLKRLQSDYQYWINLLEKLIEIDKSEMKKYVDKNYPGADDDEVQRIKKFDSKIKKYLQAINKHDNLINILEDEKWIICTPTKKIIENDFSYVDGDRLFKGLVVEFKPLHVGEYCDNLLKYGGIRLFMSGTILSKEKYCEYVGLDPKKTKYIYKKSPFPKENRPIIKDYVTKFNSKNWKSEKGLMKLEEIIKKHETEKGTIHVSSKQQAEWLIDNLDVEHMFYGCWGEGKIRDEILKEFSEDSDPSILIGPAIKDGVDLPDDLCRFQIIYKLPYPFLGDKQITERLYSKGGSDWYAYQTITSLIQAYGRGIRHKNDHCICYVVDGGMDKLLFRNKNLFNSYFLEAIVGYNGGRRRKRRVAMESE